MKPSYRFKHPSTETLRQFSLGNLDKDELSNIESHLHQCEECRQLLNSVAMADSSATLVRGQASENPEKPHTGVHSIHIEGYEIISELGRGGMGVVYKAMDLRLKRSVALKVILNGEHASREQRERLRLEAETIATLQHPGIVQIYEIGEHQGYLYLALELLDAQGLQSVMNEMPHEAKWSAALIKQLAEIIYYSHQRGIIHRDLKPQNILFSQTLNQALPSASQFKTLKNALPVLKITDFGLAKCLSSDSQMTRTGLLMGTPHYMSPEQIPDSGESVGFASDIYALGVILYQLLTGRLLFEANNLLEILKMLRHDDPIAPRQLIPGIPRDLETICLKCLMKKPAERYASAQDLAEDLALFLHDEPIRAKPLNLFQRTLKWVRHKPVLASTYVALVCLYSLHLFAMLILKLPKHQGLFHTVLTDAAMALVVIFYLMQKMLESEKWRQLGQYGLMSVTVLAITGILMLDAGALSVPINTYMYLIMGVALISPRPQLIWFQTLISTLGYLSLLGFAYWFRPDLQVSVEVGVFFVLNLVFTGLLTYLLVRRITYLNSV